MSVEVLHGVAPEPLVDELLRAMHLDLLRLGSIPSEWVWNSAWFPHLRRHPAVLEIAGRLPAAWREGEMAEPQLLLQFPDPIERELSFHVDSGLLPGWRYTSLVGVALSEWTRRNGAPVIKDAPGDYTVVELPAGSAFRMEPDSVHSSGLNVSGAIRYALYLRWMTRVE